MIEVVAAIALAVVAAILAVSVTRTYLVRKQIAESVAVAGSLQPHVARAFRRTGVPPSDRLAAGLSADATDHAGRYIDAIDIADGRIVVRLGGTADAAIAGATLSMTPFETADQEIVWICGNRAPPVGLKPLGFAGASRQPSQIVTTIEARYLPARCR